MNARAWVATAFLLAVPIHVSSAATDTLVASAQSIVFVGETGDGAAESVDWIHRNERHQLIGLGVTHQESDDSRLDIARATGAFNLTAASSLAGTLEGGSGSSGLARYGFGRATLETTRSISPRLTITGGAQYFEVDRARALLLRAETVWLPLAPLSLRAQVTKSVEGNLPTRFATLRADYVRGVQVYGGVSLGEGAQSVVELGSVRYQSFRGGFVGVAVPVSRCVLGLSWDFLELDTLSRRTATLTVAALLP